MGQLPRQGFATAKRRLASMQRLRRVDADASYPLFERLPLLVAIAYGFVAGAMGVKAIVDGGALKEIVAALIATAPILVALFWRRPLAFPYALYLLLIPLENLLVVGTLGTVTRFLGLLSAAVILLGTLRRRESVPPPGVAATLAAFVAWMIVSLGWEIGPGGGLAEIQSVAAVGLVYFAVAIYPGTGRDLRFSVAAALLGGLISSLYGLWLYGHDPTAISEGRLEISIGEDSIDPNHYADSLLVPTALAFMAAFRARTWRTRMLFAAASFVMLGGIFVTLSREALLAVGAMLLYFALRSRFHKQAWAVLAAGTAWLVAQPSFLDRLADAAASQGAGRLGIWKVGIAVFLHHWLIGTGVGSFAYAYNDFYLDVYQRYKGGWERASHNQLLHYSVELGVIGIVLLVMFVRGQFRALRAVDRTHPLFDLRIAIEGSIVALIVASFFIDLFTYKYAWVPFFLAAQLRALALRRDRSDPFAAVPPHAEHVTNYFAIPANPASGAS